MTCWQHWGLNKGGGLGGPPGAGVVGGCVGSRGAGIEGAVHRGRPVTRGNHAVLRCSPVGTCIANVTHASEVHTASEVMSGTQQKRRALAAVYRPDMEFLTATDVVRHLPHTAHASKCTLQRNSCRSCNASVS